MKALYVLAVLFTVVALALPQPTDCQQKAKYPFKKVDAQALKAKTPDSVAVIEVEHDGKPMGNIVIRFFPEAAPKHVAGFMNLSIMGFYDGTTFHRVIPGFMIQGGDPNSKNDNRLDDGQGGPGYKLDAEFNDIPHARGIVSMGRSPIGPNTAGSQFFICVANAFGLDREYTVFGEVVEGMDVADRVANVKRDNKHNPLKKVTMKSVTIKPYKQYLKSKDKK